MDNNEFIGLLREASYYIEKYGWYSSELGCYIYNPATGFELLLEEGDNLSESYCYTKTEFRDRITLHFKKGFNHADVLITKDDISMLSVIKDIIASIKKSEDFRLAKREAYIKYRRMLNEGEKYFTPCK